MAKIPYGFDKPDALRILKMSRTQEENTPALPGMQLKSSIMCYLAKVTTTITAATYDTGNGDDYVLTLGEGIVEIVQRRHYEGSDREKYNCSDPDETPKSYNVFNHENDLTRRVYNPYQLEIHPSTDNENPTLVLVVQDSFGDLYLTDKPFTKYALLKCGLSDTAYSSYIPVTNIFKPTQIDTVIRTNELIGCYKIKLLDEANLPQTKPCPICVTIKKEYTDCSYCTDWKLTRYSTCGGTLTETIYTHVDLSDYKDQWVSLAENNHCWLVEALDTDIAEEDFIEVTVTEAHGSTADNGCENCNGVWPITLCDTDPEEIIYASSGTFPDTAEADFSMHIGDAVRLNDGSCGVVGPKIELPDGETSEAINVLEFYTVQTGDTACDACKITKLVNCSNASDIIYTYADLGHFTTDDFIRDADSSDPIKCYQIDDSADPIAWDTENPPVDFNAAPKTEYGSCEECEGTVFYRLTHECTPSVCNPNNADEINDIVTNSALQSYVNQYVKYQGLVYSVAIDAVADETDPDYIESISVSGPYPTCEEALNAPISGQIPPLRKVTINETNTPQWHINTFVFNSVGQLTGICPEIVRAEGTEC